MESFIPFFKIERESRVVLYGYGNCGKRCYNQLISSGYCKLSGIIDKNLSGNEVSETRIMSIDEIEILAFDYVVICIDDATVSKEVKKEIRKRGIAEKKIITLLRTLNATVSDIGIIKDNNNLEKYMREKYNLYQYSAKRPEEYYYELFVLLKSIKKMDALNQIKSYIFQLPVEKCTIVLILLMYQYEIFDSDIMKYYMYLLNEIQWDDDTYYGLVIDTSLMIFPHPEYVYNDFFLERKNLFEKICDYYGVKRVQKNIKSNLNGKRIAIIAQRYMPSCCTDASSQIIQAYALEMRRQGFFVKIFVLYSLAEPILRKAFVERPYGSKAEHLIDYDKELLIRSGVQIYHDFIDDVSDRLVSNVEEITRFNPDIIFDLADDMFAEAYLLVNQFKIVSRPFRGGAYGSIAHKYIVRNKELANRELKKYKVINESDIVELKLGSIVYQTNANYDRKQFGFSDKDFLIITVGTRLRYEISEKMIAFMAEYLKGDEQAKWILVGDILKNDNYQYKDLVKNDKIVEWGTEKDLYALYKLCNVYLNPIRRGGGLSIRIAMIAGLPIVMSNQVQSDSIDFMNAASIVRGGEAQMIKRIHEMREDKELYERLCLESYMSVENYSMQNDVRKIVELFDKV